MHHARDGRVPREQSGSALIWALLFTVITSGLVLSHTTFMAARRGERDARYNRASIAETFAKSGLQDAVGWFHARSDQPITTFDPVYEPAGSPPRIETIAPDLGLVREFEVQGNLWGRYEVRHDSVRDISEERGGLVPGSAWEVSARGYAYRVRDASKPFDQAPNQLIGTQVLSSEIRWLQINPPAAAAVCADSPDRVQIGQNGTIDGTSGIAIAFRDPASMDVAPSVTTPTINASAAVQGTPAQLPLSTYDAAAERVFAMRLDELRGYADVILDENVGSGPGWGWGQFQSFIEAMFSGSTFAEASADAAAELESTTPETPVIENRLIVTRDFELGGTLELKNSLLVVDGDLTTAAGQNTRIEGVVYVVGDARLDKGTTEIVGSLIVRGQLRLGTGFMNSASVRYDVAGIEKLRRTVGKYRARRGRSGE